jgi:Na+-driven multidrug efflux pump
VANGLWGIKYIMSDAMRGLGRPQVPTQAEWAGLLLTVLSLPVLLPQFGISGVAAATCIGQVVVVLVLWWRSREVLRAAQL